VADLLTNAKKIYQGQPGITEGTLATVGAGKKWTILEIVIANVSVAAATFSLSIVPSGGSAGDANRIYKTVSVEANTTYPIPHFVVMAEGDFISGLQGTANGITLTINGCEV